MVKITYITTVILLMSLICCNTNTKYLEDGRTRVPINTTQVFKNQQFFDKSLLSIIDTNAIYVEQYYYRSKNKNSFDKQDNRKGYRSDFWYGTYKFYSNGGGKLFLF